MSERMDGWRECADPVELAAAVAAGVEVYETTRTMRETPGDFDLAINRNEVGFIIPASWSWSPEPPAPDDLVSRARRHANTHPESRDLIEELLDEVAVLRHDIEATHDYLDATPSPVPPWPGAETHDAGVHLGPLDDCLQCQPHGLGGGAGNREDRACVGDVSDPSPDQGVTPPPGHTTTDDCWCDPTVEVVPPAKPNLLNTWKKGQDPDGDTFLIWIDHRGAMWETDSPEDLADMLARISDSPVDPWVELVETVGRLPAPLPAPPPAPPPVPPWPGAVLSGLTDEDGVPTWLAQAGQVRGGQVRIWHGEPWHQSTSYGDDEWVEVRAPRAVPEPETERVPWWEAKGRTLPDGRVIDGWGASDDVFGFEAAVYSDGDKHLAHPDGTVEVLKDGDR